MKLRSAWLALALAGCARAQMREPNPPPQPPCQDFAVTAEGPGVVFRWPGGTVNNLDVSVVLPSDDTDLDVDTSADNDTERVWQIACADGNCFDAPLEYGAEPMAVDVQVEARDLQAGREYAVVVERRNFEGQRCGTGWTTFRYAP